MKNKINDEYIRSLSPEAAFKVYAGSDEKLFLSNFYSENPPVTDIKEMCRIFSRELPGTDKVFYTAEELDNIANFMEEHLNNYVESQGGKDKLELHSYNEMEMMDEELISGLYSVIESRYGRKRKVINPYDGSRFITHSLGEENEHVDCFIFLSDLQDRVYDEILSFAKDDYIRKHGREGILKELEKAKAMTPGDSGIDFDTVLMVKSLEHMKRFNFIVRKS